MKAIKLSFVVKVFICGGFISGGIANGQNEVESQPYPFLIPAMISVCGSIVFAAVGMIVWRYAPILRPSYSNEPLEGSASPDFWSEVLRMYRFPILMFVLAIVPGVNTFMYSGHGGPGVPIASLCFPWVLLKILFKIAKGPEESSQWQKDFSKVTIPAYIAISLPLSWLATLGLPVPTWFFFALMVSPFPWWYFT